MDVIEEFDRSRSSIVRLDAGLLPMYIFDRCPCTGLVPSGRRGFLPYQCNGSAMWLLAFCLTWKGLVGSAHHGPLHTTFDYRYTVSRISYIDFALASAAESRAWA